MGSNSGILSIHSQSDLGSRLGYGHDARLESYGSRQLSLLYRSCFPSLLCTRKGCAPTSTAFFHLLREECNNNSYLRNSPYEFNRLITTHDHPWIREIKSIVIWGVCVCVCVCPFLNTYTPTLIAKFQVAIGLISVILPITKLSLSTQNLANGSQIK
jgi:hypothetical protein